MKRYHYTYRITNTRLNKHYYGARTTPKNKEVLPIDDLGIIYFSSSKDKDFIKDQKENPSDYKYKVIHIFKTRKEAIELEIKLHNKFNVGINESFYNRAKQTSLGFDVTGTTHIVSKTTIQKIKKSWTDERKQKNSEFWTGRIHSEESKNKMSKSQKGKKLSEKTKEKIGLAKKGISNPKVTCPHCGKTGGINVMVRWHFDNCKIIN